MHSTLARRTFAIALVLAAAGCASQSGQLQAPHAKIQPPAAGPFQVGLRAPAGAHAPRYGLQALPTSPHLIGSAFLEANQQPCALRGSANLAYNTQDKTYLAVWTEELFSNGHYRIRGRIKDDYGQTQIPDFTIASSANDLFTTGNGKAVYLPWLNQFAIVYTKETEEASWGYDVFMQRISTSGALIGEPIPISKADGDQEVPDLAVDPINRRVEVVWADERSGVYTIFGRLVSFNGNQTVFLTNETMLGMSPPDPDHGYQTAFQGDPSIDFSTAQQKYVVVWEDLRNDHGDAVDENYDIYGTTLNASGMAVTDNYPVSTLQGRQYVPRIAYLAASDKFLTVFTSENNGEQDADALGVGMEGDGSVLGWGVISDQFGIQQFPVVAANDASMTWLVSYTESVNPEADGALHVMGRHVGWAFQLGDIFQVSPFVPGMFNSIGIAANPDMQEFLVDYVALTEHGQPVPPDELTPFQVTAPVQNAPIQPQPTTSASPQITLWGQRVDRGY
ncbi:MAG TPA: hypothetical protein V6D47_04380 [Oscillatoriaceae cyanobacterium]